MWFGTKKHLNNDKIEVKVPLIVAKQALAKAQSPKVLYRPSAATAEYCVFLHANSPPNSYNSALQIVLLSLYLCGRLPTDRIRASEARNTGSIPVGRTKIFQLRYSPYVLKSDLCQGRLRQYQFLPHITGSKQA